MLLSRGLKPRCGRWRLGCEVIGWIRVVRQYDGVVVTEYDLGRLTRS